MFIVSKYAASPTQHSLTQLCTLQTMVPSEDTQKVSLSLGRLKKAPAPTNGVKRSREAFRDNEDDNEVEERVSKVSHFDSKIGGAVDESNRKVEKGPLVIARQANRDWKDAANKRRRQKHGLPAEAERTGTTEPPKTYAFKAGLQISNRGANEAMAEVEQTQEVAPEPTAEASVARKTEDEAAMDALLGLTKKSELVVPALTEEDVFQNDVTEAPDMATLEDYTRVPVEQFGAAMLRGMGWKDGDGIGLNKGKKPEKSKIPERRPALLGIGAKEEAAVAQEMGTWGKAARGKRGKEPVIYNPILLKDKKTGEMFTEEEAQKRRERDEREQYEMEFEKREREREKERGKDKDMDGRRRREHEDDERERRREKDKRRDRGNDRYRDRDRDRRRHGDSEDEEERRRRKEKERRRRDRDDEDYDRERSRRHDRDNDRGRDRSREHRRR
jgi:hypothetical protein